MTYPFTLHNHTKLLKNMTSQDIIKVAIIEDLVDIANELRDLFNEEVDMRCTQVYHNAEVHHLPHQIPRRCRSL